MRLALLFEYPTLNGGERSALATLDGVRAAGFEPLALAPPQGDLAQALREAKVSLQPLEAHEGGRRLDQAERRQRLADALRALNPGLVHANSLAMSRLTGPVTAELGLPALGHVRDIMKLSKRALQDVNALDRVLVVSAAARDYHLQRGLDPARSVVLHNGVDLERFQPRAPAGYLHRELGLPAEARLLATIGQLGPRKGQDVLLKACRQLPDDAHLLVVGERNSDKDEARRYEDALHAVAEQDLAGRVHFLGRRADVHALLDELTLLVHAARQEPLGRVLLEAAASGLPVVATRVGGTEEIFPNAQAVLVEPDDPESLGAAMAELLADPERAQDLGTLARARAEAAFSAARATAGLVRHYRVVAGGSAPRNPPSRP
jgi:glycosyltransferase involved in cell wall biosynthesis